MRLLQPSQRGVRLRLECGQGVLLLLEGTLRAPSGRLLLSKGGISLSEGCGEHGDGRLLALELGLLAQKLGLLLLERRPSSLQLGSLLLGFLGFCSAMALWASRSLKVCASSSSSIRWRTPRLVN